MRGRRFVEFAGSAAHCAARGSRLVRHGHRISIARKPSKLRVSAGIARSQPPGALVALQVYQAHPGIRCRIKR